MPSLDKPLPNVPGHAYLSAWDARHAASLTKPNRKSPGPLTIRTDESPPVDTTSYPKTSPPQFTNFAHFLPVPSAEDDVLYSTAQTGPNNAQFGRKASLPTLGLAARSENPNMHLLPPRLTGPTPNPANISSLSQISFRSPHRYRSTNDLSDYVRAQNEREKAHRSAMGSVHEPSFSSQGPPMISNGVNVPIILGKGQDFRQGDWICAAPNCTAHNFSRNAVCIACGYPRPVSSLSAATASSISSASPLALVSSSSKSNSPPSTLRIAPPRHRATHPALSIQVPPASLHTPNDPNTPLSSTAEFSASSSPVKSAVPNGATMTQSILTPDGKALVKGGVAAWHTINLISSGTPDSAVAAMKAGANFACTINWPIGMDLPLPSQVRPYTELGNHPPIMNTGNIGPIQTQAGDWHCGACGYTNWRRRRVCQSCFPYADGNLDGANATAQLEKVNLIATMLMSADAVTSTPSTVSFSPSDISSHAPRAPLTAVPQFRSNPFNSPQEYPFHHPIYSTAQTPQPMDMGMPTPTQNTPMRSTAIPLGMSPTSMNAMSGPSPTASISPYNAPPQGRLAMGSRLYPAPALWTHHTATALMTPKDDHSLELVMNSDGDLDLDLSPLMDAFSPFADYGNDNSIPRSLFRMSTPPVTMPAPPFSSSPHDSSNSTFSASTASIATSWSSTSSAGSAHSGRAPSDPVSTSRERAGSDSSTSSRSMPAPIGSERKRRSEMKQRAGLGELMMQFEAVSSVGGNIWAAAGEPWTRS